MRRKNIFIPIVVCLFFLLACNNAKPPAEEYVATPEELNTKTTELIKETIEYAAANNQRIDDSIQLTALPVVQKIYDKNAYTTVWSESEKWKPIGDSLLGFIAQAKLYGLFPEDYYHLFLDSVNKQFAADSLAKNERRNAALWARADILLTDAFIHLVKDIKLGRLPQDSISLRKDSVLSDEFYVDKLRLLEHNNSLSVIMRSLEPKLPGYQQLKAAIPDFIANTSDKIFTVVPSPKKNDPGFKQLLQRRLYEQEFISFDSIQADSLTLSEAVKKFQKHSGITVDGKVGEETVRIMNITDKDKFVRLAITMDRYKLMPEDMPSRYILVNLPGYYLRYYDDDTVALTSKIICGKPITRTPLLTSAISQMITYPQWTMPTSIIVKEVLPAVKKNPGYLAKKGYSLIDNNGDEVDPYSVDWSKYSKGIPYKVVQGSGDDNALGVLKFNFSNKYAVYLHDTNQRYLFAQTNRSLSHGCVRVQEWQSLAHSLARYEDGETSTRTEDSLASWLQQKVKKSILVKNKVPLYIRYFSTDAKDGKIVFYDDMYGEDRALRQKYFAGK